MASKKTQPKKKQKRQKVKSKNKKYFLKFLVKAHSCFTIFVLVAYLVLGSFAEPGFFQRDLEAKYAWASATSSLISLNIVNTPPEKPVVAISASCNGSAPYVHLSWDNDPKADYYDVYRGGELLFLDLSDNYYSDYNVSKETVYAYYVVAKSSLGETQSEEVSITTSDCYVAPEPEPEPEPEPTPEPTPEPEPIPEPEPTPEPEPEPIPSPADVTSQINTIDRIDLSRFKCLAKTDRLTPSFSGSTNLANAQISLNLVRVKKEGSKTVLIANTVSNKNGFWYYHLSEQIHRGRYILYVTAIDPDDSTRTATARLRFNAVKVSTKKKMLITCWSEMRKKKRQSTAKKHPDNGISLKINNENGLMSGGNLNIILKGSDGVNNNPVEFRVIDSNESIVYQTQTEPISSDSESSQYRLNLPDSLPQGDYLIVARTIYGDILMSAENFFQLRGTPFLDFGGGISMTLQELLSNLSWLIIILLLLLIVFAILLLLEYLLAKNRLFDVDENNLKRDGLIS